MNLPRQRSKSFLSGLHLLFKGLFLVGKVWVDGLKSSKLLLPNDLAELRVDGVTKLSFSSLVSSQFNL